MLTLHILGVEQSQLVNGREAVERTLAGNGGLSFWLDLSDPGEAEIEWLAERFQLHPLAVEDLRLPSFHPKLTVYDGQLFLITHSVSIEKNEVQGEEIHVFLGANYLITVRESDNTPVERVRREVSEDRNNRRATPDRVLYLLLDAISDSYFDVADSIDEVIDQLEERVLGDGEPEALEQVFTLRRSLTLLRRLSTYQRDALSALMAHEGSYLHPENLTYFRDVQAMMVTMHEIVDSQRDLTNNLLEVHLSAASFRMSEVKRLTLIATIFMPISFLVGLFGTNFVFMPFNDQAWFAAFVLAIFVTVGAMLLWFRRSGWV